MSGAYDPGIDLTSDGRADALDLMVVQDAQQLGLGREGQFPDFVEEDGAMGGELEDSLLVLKRANGGPEMLKRGFEMRAWAIGLRSSGIVVRNLRGRPSEMVWIVLAWPLWFQRPASCFLQLPAVPPAVGERIGLGRKRWNRPSVRPIRTDCALKLPPCLPMSYIASGSGWYGVN